MQDKISVSQWEAFDVANYGDQLFRLIARDQLSARLENLELVCHAPTGVADLPPGSPPLFPLVEDGTPMHRSRREYFARHFDAVLIGGEDLLRFDRSEPGYGDSAHGGTRRPYDAFFDFRREQTGARPNILWNAPRIENSTTWRLSGPYRRLRSVFGARRKRASGEAHGEGPAQKLPK